MTSGQNVKSPGFVNRPSELRNSRNLDELSSRASIGCVRLLRRALGGSMFWSRAMQIGITCFWIGIATALPQTLTDSSGSGVILTKLVPPVYPPLARAAQVVGDVKVQVSIELDGGVDSIATISGHPLLVSAALDSARHSTFECRGCTQPISHTLTYTFEISAAKPDPCCCSRGEATEDTRSQVSQTRDHITLTAPRFCVCPDSCGPPDRYRSARCLYLWKCGVRRIM